MLNWDCRDGAEENTQKHVSLEIYNQVNMV